MFAVPALAGDVEEERLNHFLRTVRVVDVDRRLEVVGGVAHWCFCVSFLPLAATMPPSGGSRGERKGKPDYKAELSPEVFARFDRMRKVRRRMAEEAVVPPYVIFTDAELAAIASMPQPDARQIAMLDGIDKKRAAGYGETLIARFLQEHQTPISPEDETDGLSL